jgi:alpha-galactosidase
MSLIGFSQNGLEKFAGPGHWNDPDMLEVGNGGMNQDEYRTHVALWAILAAPLLSGNDPRNMTPETRELLTNSEVITVDQAQKEFRVDACGKKVHSKFGLSPWPTGARRLDCLTAASQP